MNIYTNNDWGYYPFHSESVDSIYKYIRMFISDAYDRYNITLYTDGLAIEELVPGKRVKTTTNNAPINPLVQKEDTQFNINQGLKGQHIALWQSHRYYFNNTANRWMWQRPKLLQTVEDL